MRVNPTPPKLSRTAGILIYTVAAVGCGLAVGANSPDHPWLMTLLAGAVMAGVLYVLERTGGRGG